MTRLVSALLALLGLSLLLRRSIAVNEDDKPVLRLSLLRGSTTTIHTTSTTPISTRDNDESDRRRQLREKELTPGTRIIATYKSNRGHRLAVSCARNIVQDDHDSSSSNKNNNNNNKEKNGEKMIILEGNGDCLHRLQHDPDIEEADFDFPVKLLSSSHVNNDAGSVRHHDGGLPLLPPPELAVLVEQQERRRTQGKRKEDSSWGLEMIKANRLEQGEHDILICMVDTGVAAGHPDLDSDKIDGEDSEAFYRETWKWNRDMVNHGTKVAGIMSSISRNGIGIDGPGLNLFVTRALDDEGFGHESDVRAAVQQCVNAGATIINISMGSYGVSARSERYFSQVVNDMGILMIAAAGNDGSSDAVYPASDPHVISVGAVTESGNRWSQSNYGSQVEFVAPGANILSTSVYTSILELDGHPIGGYHISGTGTESVASNLVYCGYGQGICTEAAGGNICLMFRLVARQSLESMLESCELSGGVGAVIFGDHSTSYIDSWGVAPLSSDMYIPAMAVDWYTGLDLMESRLGDTVVVGEVTNDVSTYTYEVSSGTSFAAPHVAVAAALVWSHFGSSCTNHQIRYALAVSAQGSNMAGRSRCNDEYGHGVVNAKAAYEWLLARDCSTWDVPEVSRGGCTTLEGDPVP